MFVILFLKSFNLVSFFFYINLDMFLKYLLMLTIVLVIVFNVIAIAFTSKVLAPLLTY